MARRTGKRARIDSAKVTLAPEARARAASGTAIGLFLSAWATFLLFCSADFTHQSLWSQILFGLSTGACILSPFVGVLGMLLALRREKGPGTIEATDEGFVYVLKGRRVVVPHALVRAGWTTPTDSGHAVEFTLPWGDVLSAQIDHERDGLAMLDALGLDVSQKTFTVRLGAARRRLALAVTTGVVSAVPVAVLATMIGAIFGLNGAAIVRIVFALGTIAVLAGQMLFGGAKLTVGADGIRIASLRRERFVPFARVRNVRIEAPDILVETMDGEAVRIPSSGLGGVERATVLARIEHAIANAGRSRERAPLELLERRGRGFDEWRREIRALLDGKAGYRSAGLTRADVMRALEDPDTSPEQRIGAALALADDGDEARTQVRVVAEACANEPVRVALAKIAEGELDEPSVERAVAAVPTRH